MLRRPLWLRSGICNLACVMYENRLTKGASNFWKFLTVSRDNREAPLNFDTLAPN